MLYSGETIKCLILTVFLAFLPAVLFGEEKEDARFASHKLQELFCRLPLEALPKTETRLIIPDVTDDKEITFTFNGRKQLSHLGISIFCDEIKQIHDREVCNFIERLFLELLLQPDSNAVRRKLDELNISLTFCGQKFGEGLFKSIQSVLHMTDRQSDFILRNRQQEGDATWTSGNQSLHLKFPLSRELIEGTDKKEADDKVCGMIRDAVSKANVPQENLNPEKPEKLSHGIYVSRGVVGQVQQLSSDIYYTMKNGKYELLYDEKFPEYSMNNLFLTFKNGKGKKLHIVHRQYGNSEHEITVPLTSFLSCFMEDFQPTCHTSFNKNGDMETIIVFQHKTLNYIHMLKASADKDELFGPSATINADLYSNIPQHYIKTLLQ